MSMSPRRNLVAICETNLKIVLHFCATRGEPANYTKFIDSRHYENLSERQQIVKQLGSDLRLDRDATF